MKESAWLIQELCVANIVKYNCETGTGDITSQYEYWLSRRLKGEYDVVNKGYGQEKLVDMVERFDRDIVPLNPKYCILHGGTNDYVNTYIVRCMWKRCNVFLRICWKILRAIN